MLHFIIGTAVCIWIAERVTHWRHQRRYRKLVAEMLNTRPRFAPTGEQPPRTMSDFLALEQRPPLVKPKPALEPWQNGCRVISIWK